MIKNTEHTLSKIFTAGFDILSDGLPERLNSARGGYMEDFMLAGLPTSRDERFLQSDMRELFDAEGREIYFTPAVPSDAETAPFAAVEGITTIVFKNGFAAAEGAVAPATDGHSDSDLDPYSVPLPEPSSERIADSSSPSTNGVFCGSLREGFAQFEREGRLDELLAVYNSLADNKNDALTALSGAFMQDGLLVWIPAGVSLAEPLLIDNRFSSDEEAQLCFGRTLIVLDEGAEADISILYRTAERGRTGSAKGQTVDGADQEADNGADGGIRDSTGSEAPDTRFLVDHVREIVVGKGARLHLSEAAMTGSGSSLLLTSYLRQEADSHTDSVFASLGRGFSRLSLHTDLAGRQAETSLSGLYLSPHEAHNDIELIIGHLYPDCRSRQLVRGVAAGEATGVFTGKIFVARDAQRTDAAQHNRNLQLTDSSRIYTRPQLEIYADDVKCGHGATVGRLDEEAVFYLRQRGIDEDEARRMQLHGFANDIINSCRPESFRKFVASAADELINEF